MPKLTKFLRCLLVGALIIQSFTFLAKTWWFFELFTHYAPYYAVIALFFTLITLVRHEFRSALTWVTLASINLAILSPYLLATTPASATSSQTLKILSQNFFYEDTDVDAFAALVAQENPDIVIVVEASDLWKTALNSFRTDYPYLHLTRTTGIHGIFIASRIAGTFKEVPLGEQTGLVFTPEDQTYQVLAVHPDAPLTAAWAKDRNAQFTEIARLTHTSPVPVLVLGDFNCTPWSPYFTDLLKDSGLKDAGLGYGLTPSWHAHNPLFQISIDHALVSPEIQVQNFKTLPSIDSDHRGILLKINNPASLSSTITL